MREITPLLSRLGADSIQTGGPEADIFPLWQAGVPAVALNTDASRYFWYHHTEADTVEKLDPVDLARCVAVMAVVANTVANMDGRIPRHPSSNQE